MPTLVQGRQDPAKKRIRQDGAFHRLTWLAFGDRGFQDWVLGNESALWCQLSLPLGKRRNWGRGRMSMWTGCVGAEEVGRCLKLRKKSAWCFPAHCSESPEFQPQIASGGRVRCGAGIREGSWGSKG